MMMPALSPEMLAERIQHERELRQQTERYVSRALRKQADEYERRLDSLADLRLGPITERIDKVESWQDQWNGRVIGLGVIGSAILGLLLAHMAGIGV